jgi:hypothetical protein
VSVLCKQREEIITIIINFICELESYSSQIRVRTVTQKKVNRYTCVRYRTAQLVQDTHILIATLVVAKLRNCRLTKLIRILMLKKLFSKILKLLQVSFAAKTRRP